MYTPNVPNDISKGFSKWGVPKQAFQNRGIPNFGTPVGLPGAFRNRGVPKRVPIRK
jgi:hypothetical protein